MKRIACMLLSIALLAGLLTCAVSAAPTDGFSVDAKGVMLIDLNTGDTVYELEPDQTVYPASLTKIMTAILAIEKGTLTDVVTASSTALTGLDPDGTSVWLSAGEQMSLNDLLYCMLLASANDACNVVAEHIAGSIDAFVEMMNAKAAELGCTGTHFNNTNGLPDDNHYTTARDLALIAQYAIQNPTFWEIDTTTSYTVPATNVFDARMLVTTNSMATTYKYYTFYDERVQGVKTGYTAAAGRCLIVTATEGDSRLLSVVCGAPDTMMYNNVSWYGHYAVTEQLLNYGFETLSGSADDADTDPADAQSDPAQTPVQEDPVTQPEAEAPAQEPASDAAADTPAELPSEPVTDGLVSTEPTSPTSTQTEKSFPWGLVIILAVGILLEACIVYVLYYRHQYKAKRVQRRSPPAHTDPPAAPQPPSEAEVDSDQVTPE